MTPPTKHRNPSRQRGFTLIELLIAIVLGAMLMSAVVVMLRAVMIHRNRVDDIAAWSATTGSLIDQLRRDITNAEMMMLRPGALWLSGNLARDPMSGQAMHAPATVGYGVARIGSRNMLVRSQSLTNGGIAAGVDVQPVWIDAGALWVTSTSLASDFGGPDSAYAGSAVMDPLLIGEDESLVSPGPADMQPVPASLRVQVFHLDGGTIVDETIVHHSEAS